MPCESKMLLIVNATQRAMLLFSFRKGPVLFKLWEIATCFSSRN